MRKEIPSLPFVRIRKTRPNLAKAARIYVRSGFPILPVYGVTDGKCDCGKPKCGSAGKHPIAALVPNGVKDATRDLSTVRSWWKQYPNANIGVRLDGMTVIDVDGQKGHEAATDDWRLKLLANVGTGRGGHLYVHGETRTRTGILPGVDIKSGADAYVVAPPSRHVSGDQYRARYDDMFEMSEDIVQHVLAGRERTQDNRRKSRGRKIGEGSRNDYLIRVGGAMRAINFDESDIATCLTAINQVKCDPPLDTEEVSRIANSAASYESWSGEYFGEMADVEARQIDWLWKPYIPLAMPTVLDGDPGLGKSFLTLWIAAAVTRGWKLPGQATMEPASVLILNAEDDPSFTLRPRLEAIGADLSRVRYEKATVNISTDGILRLREELREFPASLVIIDPLFAHISVDTDVNRANQTRKFMTDLSGVARDFRTSILCVRHVSKADRAGAIQKGLGSIDIIAAARSGLMVLKDPDDPSSRLLVHIKSNNEELGPTQRFRLEKPEGGKSGVPAVAVIGTSEFSVSDIDAPEANPVGRPPEARQTAITFLRGMLASGQMRAKKVQEQAVENGISLETLNRAKDDLKVSAKKRGRYWYWALSEAVS